MKLQATYINLAHRTDRKEETETLWCDIAELTRFDAIKGTPPITGIYEGHRKIIASLGSDPVLILEDDATPCKDFNDRLALFSRELPEDWDIFMLGFFTTHLSRYSVITDHITKAQKNICGTHCYFVNPLSKSKVLAEFSDPRNEKNIDLLMFNLQSYLNVYLAMPSMAYQRESFSDNSMSNDGGAVSKGTKTYFKDKL